MASPTLLRDVSIWQWEESLGEIKGHACKGWILIDTDGRISRTSKTSPISSPAHDSMQESEPNHTGLTVIDGRGELVLPGLIDSHIHVAGLGESRSFLQLGTCSSISDLQAVLSSAAANAASVTTHSTAFIQGTHWAQEKLGRYPTRLDLDVACSDRPVLFWRACWHVVVCNTQALRLAGLLTEDMNLPCDFVQPPGGIVDLDASGRPTGVLRESAVELITAVTAAKSLAQLRHNVTEGLKQCVSFGLTAVQTNDERCLRAYKTLQAEDRLPLRCFLTPVLAELGEDAAELSESHNRCSSSKLRESFQDLDDGEVLTPERPAALLAPGTVPSATEDDRMPSASIENKGTTKALNLWDATSRLVVERLKIFSDGSLGAETAALRTEAAILHAQSSATDTSNGIKRPFTEYRGVLIHSNGSLLHQMEAARRRGFRLEVHAIGDAAAAAVLDCMETCGVTALERPVITHCQVLGADLILRMAKLGCVANIQASFVPTDMEWARLRLASSHLQYSYAWKTLLYTKGIIVAGGSDAPIETASPLVGIYDAIHRRSRVDESEIFKSEECLTFAEALWTYTIGGAYACGMEHLVGQIKPGKIFCFRILVCVHLCICAYGKCMIFSLFCNLPPPTAFPPAPGANPLITGFAADLTLVSPDILSDLNTLVRSDAVKRVFIGGKLAYCALEGEKTTKDDRLGGPFFPGKNGMRRTTNPWGGKCLCCRVR